MGLVSGLAMCEWQVSVLDHVLNLSLHGDPEEHDEIHDEDGPEDRDIEEVEESAENCNHCGLCHGVPELELGQATDEWAELLVHLRGQLRPIIFILCQSRVNLWREKCNEEVQVVDPKSICYYIPALQPQDSQNEQ